MPDRYQRLFGASAPPPAGGFDEAAFRRWYETWAKKLGLDPNPDDPRHHYDYRAAYKAGASPGLDKTSGEIHWPSQFKADDHPNRFVGIIDTKTGKPRQIPGAEPGLGKVETPEPLFLATPGNMLPVVNPKGAWNLVKEATGLAGATAADVNVGTARLPSAVLKGAADTLKRGAENLDPKGRQKRAERADAYMKLFGNPSMAEALQDSHEARALKLDPLRPASETTGRWTEEARGRLAEATQDLPTPVAVGVHQAATMAGMLVDPTLAAGGGSKAPRALSELEQLKLARSGVVAEKRGLTAWEQLVDKGRELAGRPWRVHEGYGDLGTLEIPKPPGDLSPRPRQVSRQPIPVFIEGTTDPVVRDKILSQWSYISSRHPRLAAKVERIYVPPEGSSSGAYWDHQGTLGVSLDRVDDLETFAHEITHIGQGPLYRGDIADPEIARSVRGAREGTAHRRGEAYRGEPRRVSRIQDSARLTNEELDARYGAVRDALWYDEGLKPIDRLRYEAELRVLDMEIEHRLGGETMLPEPAGDYAGTPDSVRDYLPSERQALKARAKGMRRLLVNNTPVASSEPRHFGPVGQRVDELDQLRYLGMRATPEEGAELARLSLPIGEDLLRPGAVGDRALQVQPAAKFAPPGPEAQGGIVASRSPLGGETVASPPLSDQVADPLSSRVQYGEGTVASPPLGPRPIPGEAGFIKLRPDPLPPADAAAKEAAWRMRKDYAATERLGRYRAGARAEELQRLIPKETDEALTWMFHELGDPRAYANRPAEIAAKIAKKPGAKRRVIEQIFADPNAESALQEVASWREQTKAMWDDLSDMWDLGFVKNYVHMTYAPPKGVKTVNPISFGSVGATPGLTRSRTFLNPAEAMAAGWTPRTLRFSQLRAETEKVFAHAQAIRGLVDDLATMPLLQDGRPALTYATMGKQPKGYVRVSGVPVLEKAAQRSATSARALPEAVRHAELLQAESRRAAETAAGFYRYTPEGGVAPSVIEQPLLPGTEGLGPQTFRPPRTPTTPGDLWVHPKIWEELKPVLDVAEPLAVDRLLGTVKRIKFLGSIFHPFELGLAAMQSMGPVKGAKAWASRGGGIPGLAQLAERRGWASPFTREVAEKWVRRGLGVEAPSADMMTDSFQRAMVDWEDMMTRAAGKAGAVARAAGAAGKGLRATAAYYDEAIWKILHSPIKIAAAEQWEAQLLAARAGDKGALGVANRFLTPSTRARLAAMTDEEVGEAVASAINNHFGGQVWELSRNRLFSDPRALKWMRRIFLSPDWNVSAISSGLSPLSSDPVHRIIGRTYWTNITALAAGFSVLNYALTAGSEQGPHFPWENEEGHKMDLETPFRTDKGRKIFYRIGKHAQELPHFAWGTPGAQQLKFMAGKTSPWVGAAAGLMGKSVTEFPSPYEVLVRERDRTGEEPGPVEDLASRLEPTAEMALPFSLQDAEDPGDVLRRLLISIPESKGMSTYKAENLFAQALYDNDRPRQEEIIGILRQNGYDDEAIGFMIQGAKRKAKRRLRAGR